MKLFIGSTTNLVDRDQFVHALEGSGLMVVRHREILTQGAPDETWMKKVSEMGCYAFTSDYRIARNQVQTKIVMKYSLGIFVIRNKNSTHQEKGKIGRPPR